MNRNEINIYVKLSIIMLFFNVLLWCILQFFNGDLYVLLFIASADVFLGAYSIYTLYKKTKILVTPISIFSLVWLILIPLTSGNAPLMNAMTKNQWSYCLGACVFFSIGSILSGFFHQEKYKYRDSVSYQKDWVLTKPVYIICTIILVIGIILYFLQAIVAGTFPIFSANPNHARNNFFVIPGSALVSNIGFLSIYIIYCDNTFRRKKLFVFLTIIYFIIQILMTVRFLLFLIIISAISTYGNQKLTKKKVRALGLFLILAIIGFIFVSMYRGGLEDKQSNFIATHIYNGTAESLVSTEIVRYFGMSQRTMETYMQAYAPGISEMGHTFYPILTSIGISPNIPTHFGIYGYTACNIITYFYLDAGRFWWLLLIVWSFFMNDWYFRFKNNPSSIINKYLWGISAIGITMSFYCYINAYSYWYFHYIIILLILNKINNHFIFKSKNTIKNN